MSKIVHGDDSDPIGRMEIDEEDRAQIRAIAARRALRWAIIVTAVMTTFTFIQRLMDRPLDDWPLWAHSAGWFVLAYFGVFTWTRNSMLEKTKDMMDAHNAQLRAEYQQLQEDLRNGRTADSSRLADQRSER